MHEVECSPETKNLIIQSINSNAVNFVWDAGYKEGYKVGWRQHKNNYKFNFMMYICFVAFASTLFGLWLQSPMVKNKINNFIYENTTQQETQ